MIINFAISMSLSVEQLMFPKLYAEHFTDINLLNLCNNLIRKVPIYKYTLL